MAAAKRKTDENDFDALDRLARSITPAKLKPLSTSQKQQWKAAKRGRPRKAPAARSVPTLITIEPKLLQVADAYAKKSGVSRSKLFSDAVRLLLSQ
jgi:hypothetical protein